MLTHIALQTLCGTISAVSLYHIRLGCSLISSMLVSLKCECEQQLKEGEEDVEVEIQTTLRPTNSNFVDFDCCFIQVFIKR